MGVAWRWLHVHDELPVLDEPDACSELLHELKFASVVLDHDPRVKRLRSYVEAARARARAQVVTAGTMRRVLARLLRDTDDLLRDDGAHLVTGPTVRRPSKRGPIDQPRRQRKGP